MYKGFDYMFEFYYGIVQGEDQDIAKQFIIARHRDIVKLTYIQSLSDLSQPGEQVAVQAQVVYRTFEIINVAGIIDTFGKVLNFVFLPNNVLLVYLGNDQSVFG